MSYEDAEDAPATRIANCLSECINAVALLGVFSEWGPCETEEAGERKPKILWALSLLLSVAPLVELPALYAPKRMIRRCIALAAELHPLVAAWDEATEPTPAMITTARGFFTCLNDPEMQRDVS